MNPIIVRPSENQNAFDRSPSAQMPTSTSSLYCNTSRTIRFFCKDLHETLKYVDELSELKNDEIQKEHTHTHLSLSTCRSADAL